MKCWDEGKELKVSLSDEDIEDLKRNLSKARYVEEGYKYSLVFNQTSISMLTGGGEVKFIIRINQAINVWFEICNKQTELRQLILAKRESEMKLKEHYNYGRLLTLFQEDMK